MLEFSRYRPEVAVLRFNRPERRNALSLAMLEQMLEHLEALRTDPTARVLLVQGNGATFCGGIDLQEAAQSPETAFAMFEKVTEMILTLRRLPQIVIVSAQGHAVGGGAALIAVGDLTIGDAELRIAAPEVRRGFETVLLFPLFRRKIGDAGLRQLLLTGQSIDAVRAREIGLLQYVVPSEERIARTERLAEEVCEAEPHALKEAKILLTAHENSSFEISLEEELRLSLRSHIESWKTAAAQEGVAAFLEKRRPGWA